MSNIPTNYNDEIDLVDLIEAIWNGKWVILSIVGVSILLVFSFNILTTSPMVLYALVFLSMILII